VWQYIDMHMLCQNVDMSQVETVGPVDEAVGYVLKQATTALRAAMDTVLRPLELTVPQYSCLEVLDQRPGLSSSELARATFVTRQSMNLVLQGLQQRGLLTRATVAHHGKALPTKLTATGRAQLRAASVAVRTIEKQMLAPLTPSAQQRLLADLAACAAALTGDPRTKVGDPRTKVHEHS
jgi:DNA-binding MarR family transcriptional regulator